MTLKWPPTCAISAVAELLVWQCQHYIIFIVKLEKNEFKSWFGHSNSAATYAQKIGGDLEPKQLDSTWDTLSRLNGSDSQVYVVCLQLTQQTNDTNRTAVSSSLIPNFFTDFMESNEIVLSWGLSTRWRPSVFWKLELLPHSCTVTD